MTKPRALHGAFFVGIRSPCSLEKAVAGTDAFCCSAAAEKAKIFLEMLTPSEKFAAMALIFPEICDKIIKKQRILRVR